MLIKCRSRFLQLTTSRILDILQDKTLFCAFEAGDIVCWLVSSPNAKLDLFKSADCRWICKTNAQYCYRNSATVRRLVQSPTLQSTIFCGCPSDLRGKGIRVSPAWLRSLRSCSTNVVTVSWNTFWEYYDGTVTGAIAHAVAAVPWKVLWHSVAVAVLHSGFMRSWKTWKSHGIWMTDFQVWRSHENFEKCKKSWKMEMYHKKWHSGSTQNVIFLVIFWYT